MTTKLRLRADAEQALRREAELLGLAGDRPAMSDRDVVGSSGLALPARRAFEELDELVRLPDGLTTIDLLQR